MKKSTKVLALLLTLTLMFSCFSVFAFASEAVASQNEGAEETVKPIEVKFTTENILDALNYLWQGMLSIFIVIGVLVLATYALNKISNSFASKKED